DLLLVDFHAACNWRDQGVGTFVVSSHNITDVDVRFALDVRCATFELEHDWFALICGHLYNIVIALFPSGCRTANFGQIGKTLWLASFEKLFYTIQPLCSVVSQDGTRA